MPYCHLLFGSLDKPHVKLIMQIPLGKLKHLFHTSPDFKVKAFLKVSFQPQPNRTGLWATLFFGSLNSPFPTGSNFFQCHESRWHSLQHWMIS